MELRRCNFHYINSIKMGLSVKVPNVSRGRPGLKFKKMEDILGSEYAKNKISTPAICSKAVFHCCADIIVPKSEPTDFDCIDDITLKQLKDKCKAKKRKLSSYVDSSKGTNLQLIDEDIDLTQPLSSWKNKKSKKKKQTNTSSSGLSQSFLDVVVKSEPFSSDQEFLVRGVNCDSQDVLHDFSDSSQNCDEQVGFDGGLSSEVSDTGNGHELSTSSSGISTKKSQSYLNKDSHEPQAEPYSTNCVLPNSLSGKPSREPRSPVKEDSQEPSKHTEHDLTNCVLPTSLSGESSKEPQSPINEYSHKSEEHLEPDATNCVTSTSLSSASTKEPQSPVNEDSDNSENQIFIIHDNCIENSSMHEMPFQKPCDNSYQSASISSIDSLQCLEFIDDISNDLPTNFETGAIIIPDDCRTSSNFDLRSSPCNSPTNEQKQFQSPSLVDTTNICSSTISPDDDHPDEQLKLSEVDHQHTKPQQSPERLFSTRKAISPTSQEKLCKAMGSVQLTRNGQEKCKMKLKYGKQRQIRRAEVISNQKHSIRKAKYKDDSHLKGILKGPHQFPGTPTFSSSQSCSQTAIKFSQRQMQDIECLAYRLTKELNSMKEIVKDAVYFEASSATALKHNVDKVRVAIENATKLEESTKRYLSVMARDCSRFCKIMKLSDDKPAASNSVVHKERKKIIFADEAGERLCHVKIIYDETAILMESNGGKHEVLVR